MSRYLCILSLFCVLMNPLNQVSDVSLILYFIVILCLNESSLNQISDVSLTLYFIVILCLNGSFKPDFPCLVSFVFYRYSVFK